MFIVIKRKGIYENIIYENEDFNKCVDTRQKKMAGSDPSVDFVIYRKQDYLDKIHEDEQRMKSYNQRNKRKHNNDTRRKENTKRS